MVVVWSGDKPERQNAEKCNSSQRRLNHLRNVSFEKKIQKWLIGDISILKLVGKIKSYFILNQCFDVKKYHQQRQE